MKGLHKVIVQNNRLHYEFDIRRNITIIQGNSATGKTTLINMLRQAENLGADSEEQVVTGVVAVLLCIRFNYCPISLARNLVLNRSFLKAAI